MTPESKLKSKVTDFCKARGLHVIRLSFSRGVTSGWPDVVVLRVGGQPLFIELKAPGKVPTELQSHRIITLRDLGYDVLATDNFNEARSAITQRMGAPAVHEQGVKLAGEPARRRPTPPPRRA